MRRVEAILAAALAIALAGCVVRGQPKTAAAPPPPQPAAAPAAPAQPPAPLSIPQTQVQLPPLQPLNPDALPPTTVAAEPPADVAPTAPGGRANRGVRPPAANASPPKPEATPAPVPPPAAPAVVDAPRQPIQEVVSASEQKRLQDSAQARRREIQQWLSTDGRRHMTRHQQSKVTLIRGFLKGSEDAERSGDMRQADALAERAQILLRELQNGQ